MLSALPGPGACQRRRGTISLTAAKLAPSPRESESESAEIGVKRRLSAPFRALVPKMEVQGEGGSRHFAEPETPD
jgi:hypothetical protein